MLLRRIFTGITRLSLRYKWVTIALTLVFVILGVVAATQLNQELLPRIEFPQTIVVALRAGASSEDLRDLVTIPLEQEVSKIPGVITAGLESTTSTPASGLSLALIQIRTEYGFDLAAINARILAAIQKIAAEGVPTGLRTTADLTPDIMTAVIRRAPSMWRHFEAQHFQAMSIEVIDAALRVNPDLINQVDLLTRDQLTARRVDIALTNTTAQPEPVTLPRAWRVTAPLEKATTAPDLNNSQPQIIAFSLSDLPIITASVASTDPNTSPAALREFVEKEVVEPLKALPGVADVSVSGGQQIPKAIMEAAAKAVEQQNPAPANNPPPQNTPPANPTPRDPAPPALPQAWRGAQGIFGVTTQVRLQYGVAVAFNDAADLTKATDGTGKVLPPSDLLNKIAELNNTLLPALTPEVLAYLRAAEPEFIANLTDKALDQLSLAVLSTGAWSQLAQQPGFKAAGFKTLSDVGKFRGSFAQTLNAIVLDLAKDSQSFAIRLVDGLTPEAIAYLLKREPDFPSALDGQVLRYMSSEALKALPASFIDGLSDEALKAELKAIMADPAKEAAASLNTNNGAETGVVDDPNAPPMPDSWVQALAQFGLDVRTANDLFKPPFRSPAAFFNQSAANPGSGNLMKEISAELLLYIQGRDPKFFDELTPATIQQFSPETLAKLPPEVQAKASGEVFSPTTTVTRADGQDSLVLSIVKQTEANTVAVAHAVDKLLEEVQKNDPAITIAPVFEQAPFIEQSIEGVAREGALGAVGAVIVILFFLNFSVRSTLVTAVSIPTSVAIALVLMRWLPEAARDFLLSITPPPGAPLEGVHTFVLRLFPAGITLNIMTLSGLTVAIGRVVDDSIVVLENIYRQLQKGMEPLEAAVKGTRDVCVAIFAATLTTVVVFLPIGLTGGIVGEFFLPFGLAVTYALLASFLVAITVVPTLAFMFITRKSLKEEHEGRLERAYHGALQWALNHRFAVLAIAAVTFVIGMILFASRPTTFLPQLGEPQISIGVSMPPGTPLAQTDALARKMESFLESKRGSGIARYQTTVGSGGGFESFFGMGSVDGAAASMAAAVTVREEALNALTQEIRDQAEAIFGKEHVRVSRATLSEQGFGGFAVVISGPEEDLRAVNARVIETLSTVKGLTNVTSSLIETGDSNSYLRVGMQTAVQYSGELEVTDTLGVTREAIAAVRAIPDLPTTLTVGEGFQSQTQTQGFAQTFSAMGIAIVIVYLVMVLTFGSLIHPFTILFTLPLAVVGAAAALWLTNRVVGLSALVGLLMLIGIVVTNAIVMLDRVQQNRKERGMAPREALIEGARTRLRPILMTALATIVALSPLAAGFSEGAIIATELGTVVIGGLFSSTLLTLLVIPVVYSLFDAAQRRVFGRRERQVVATGD